MRAKTLHNACAAMARQETHVTKSAVPPGGKLAVVLNTFQQTNLRIAK